MELHWFLPTHGDGRELARDARGDTRPGARREPDPAYLAQVAAAADGLGFHGALVPFGMFCEDPWVVAGALAAVTTRLRFMLAVRPGVVSPVLTAQAAATLQRFSGGRVDLNVVTGGDADEQRRYGDHLDHDSRYARTGEFLQVLRRAWSGERYDHDGEHFRVHRGLLTRPWSEPPRLFLGGSSAAATHVAARYGDVLLTWGEPPAALAASLARARAAAAGAGRRLVFGTRFHVISRDTSAEAWAVAEQLLRGMDPGRVEQAQRRFARSESEGQRRMAALHAGRTDRLEVHPNVWAGYGLVRPGVGTALVGSHEEVADRLAEYHTLGVDHVILSGQPHLEEAWTVGEGVLPLLRGRGLLGPAAPARQETAAGA